MTSVVRFVRAYYEQSGAFAVPPSLAEDAFTGAAELVGEYTGRILVKVEGVDLRTKGKHVTMDDAAALGGSHRALLTRRELRDSSVKVPRGARLAGLCETNSIGSSVMSSSFVLTAESATTADEALQLAAPHELGHSFGLRDCTAPLGTCIMNGAVELGSTGGVDVAELLQSPFCGDCSDQLRDAGQRSHALMMR